jgi:hypothetical protein
MTYPLHGLTPLGSGRLSEGEYFDSLLALQSLDNTRSLYYALSGTETDGTPAAPSAGHAHDTANTELNWMQVGSWRTATLLDSDRYLARVVNETSATQIALAGFILPPGSTTVTPRAHVVVPNGTTLTLLYEFFTPAGLNGAASASVTLTKAGPWDDGDEGPAWFNGSNVDLSGLAETDGKRIVYVRVKASVDTATADVAGFALGLTDESSAPGSVALDEALALANEDLSPDDLAALFITNPERLRQLVFGVTYPLPRHSRPHDHGEGRGEPLERHLLSMVYGPHLAEGGGATAGGTIGIPILEPAVGVNFETTPKVLAQQGFFAPGQVDNVAFRLAAYLPGGGTESVDLIVEVRPLGDVGYGPGENLGIIETVTLTASGGDTYAEGEASMDLSPLGDIHRDRVFDVTIWQASNPGSGKAYRLCSLLAHRGTAPTSLPELATHQPREEITYAKILEGQEVSTLLAAKIHRVLNQVTLEALGGVPGLESDLSTPDTSDPWLRQLSETHKHRGSFDDDSGNRVDDGAPVRLPLWAQAYVAHVAADTSGAEDTLGTTAPVLGHKLHPSTSTTLFGGRCSIPKGLRAVEVYALVQPGIASLESRLWAYCNADPTNGDTAIHVAMRSGPFAAQADGVGNDLVCQVLPQDGAAWAPNATRLAAGQSVWTVDALKSVADLPSTVSVTNIPRWTQPIRIELEPAPDASEGYAYDIDLRLSFLLQFGTLYSTDQLEDETTWATGARLLSVLVVPAADDPTPQPSARSMTRNLGSVTNPTLPSGGGGGAPSAHASSHHSGGSDPLSLGSIAGTVGTSQIADGAVTNAKIRDGGACSVIGRSANSSGDVADISAASDGQILRRSGGVLGFGTIPASSVTGLVPGGVASKWNPWAPPSSIHALGDEFDDSSLDGKWSTWNPATLLTVTEDPKGLKLAGTDDPASSHSVMGLFQAIGADDEWEIVTRAAVTTSLGDGGLAGLLLLQDPDINPTTSDLLHFYVRSGTTGPDIVGLNRHTAYNAAPTVVATNEYRASNAYLLIQYKKTGNLYSAWRSSDGIGWTSLVRATSPVFTPGFLGVGINPFQRDMHGRFEFFRVRSAASGLYDVFPEPLGG